MSHRYVIGCPMLDANAKLSCASCHSRTSTVSPTVLTCQLPSPDRLCCCLPLAPLKSWLPSSSIIPPFSLVYLPSTWPLPTLAEYVLTASRPSAPVSVAQPLFLSKFRKPLKSSPAVGLSKDMA